MKNFSAQRGFTLVELLIVISIIGILTSVVFMNITGSLIRSRDSQRKANLQTIRNTLEMYYNNQPAPTYPTTAQGLSVLVPTYTQVVPKDPQDPTRTYNYSSDGRIYTLSADLENDSDSSRSANCLGTADYCVYNP